MCSRMSRSDTKPRARNTMMTGISCFMYGRIAIIRWPIALFRALWNIQDTTHSVWPALQSINCVHDKLSLKTLCKTTQHWIQFRHLVTFCKSVPCTSTLTYLLSALPTPPRLMQRACSHDSADRQTQTHTRTSSIATPSPLAKRHRESNYAYTFSTDP